MIDVLIVRPGVPVEVASIAPKVPDFMRCVGGAVFQARLGPRVMLACNEEGDRLALTPNRRIWRPGPDVIRGTFILCGAKGEEPVSLAPHHLAIWRAYFDATGAYAPRAEA